MTMLVDCRRFPPLEKIDVDESGKIGRPVLNFERLRRTAKPFDALQPAFFTGFLKESGRYYYVWRRISGGGQSQRKK